MSDKNYERPVSEKKKYVVIHAYDLLHPDRVLLVEKDRPAWQKGCLNLLGGKVEQGEEAIDTTIRELKEESGLKVRSLRRGRKLAEEVDLMGAIVSEKSIVYCMSLPVDSEKPLKPRKGETEVVAWYNWSQVKGDFRLMPNLRCIVPLMRQGVSGWFLSGDPIAERIYEATIRFMLDAPVPHHSEE
jgi:8-oxo-dGTP pyrophosphatase MutT (NUDIX family)